MHSRARVTLRNEAKRKGRHTGEFREDCGSVEGVRLVFFTGWEDIDSFDRVEDEG